MGTGQQNFTISEERLQNRTLTLSPCGDLLVQTYSVWLKGQPYLCIYTRKRVFPPPQLAMWH
jgi:hypothetical protein